MERWYFAGFYFRDFNINEANMKKGIKFRDSSVLNLILFFFNPLNILKYRDKMKEAKRVLTLFQYGRHSHGMERTSKTS